MMRPANPQVCEATISILPTTGGATSAWLLVVAVVIIVVGAGVLVWAMRSKHARASLFGVVALIAAGTLVLTPAGTAHAAALRVRVE